MEYGTYMSEEADFVTILSSDMIAQIVEGHFNKKVYKQQVKVVDARATEAGYMFSLAFIQQPKTQEPLYTVAKLNPPINRGTGKRNSKGQFAKDNM